MPKAYEAMRDKFMRQGLGQKAAKKKAARIYNSKRKKKAVHRGLGQY